MESFYIRSLFYSIKKQHMKNKKTAPNIVNDCLAQIFVRQKKKQKTEEKISYRRGWCHKLEALPFIPVYPGSVLTAPQGHPSSFVQVAPCSWTMHAFPWCVILKHIQILCAMQRKSQHMSRK